MKKILYILFLAASLLHGGFDSWCLCSASGYSNNDGHSEMSVDPDQSANEVARRSSQIIKRNYATLGEFISDYESGKKNMDASVRNVAVEMTRHDWNTPQPYLNNLTRSQYREDVATRITRYDLRIEQLISHQNLEQRAKAELPELQARAQQMGNVMTAGMFGGPLRMARAMAKMESDPTRLMVRARWNVAEADNQEAAQLQALRNKLYQQVLALDSAKQKSQDKIGVFCAGATVAYNEFVGHRVDSFTNTSAKLRTSANSFLKREQHNDRAKLINLQLQAQTNASDSQRRLADAAQAEITSSGTTAVAAGGNGAIPTQYFPGPDGIGGKTIPGVTGFGPPITWPQSPTIIPMQPPNIYVIQPSQTTPLTWPSMYQ